jgi:hypothetical protein
MDVLWVARKTCEWIGSSSGKLLDLNIDRRRTHTTSANPRDVLYKVDSCSSRLRSVKEPQSDIPRKTLSDRSIVHEGIHNLTPRRHGVLCHELLNVVAHVLFVSADLLLSLTTAVKDATMVVADDIIGKRIVGAPAAVVLDDMASSFTKRTIAIYVVLKDASVLTTAVSIHMSAGTADTIRFE